MTIVVLLILAIVWAVVLVPPWLRNRSESRPADSISSFARQLSVLERTAPPGIAPAVPIRRGPAPQPLMPITPPPRSRASRASAQARARVARPMMSRQHALAMHRRLARKRRRDIFTGLLVLVVATLALSFVPSLEVLRMASLVLGVLFVAYVAMLVRAQRLAWEREMKVHYLPGSVPEPALLLRRSAN